MWLPRQYALGQSNVKHTFSWDPHTGLLAAETTPGGVTTSYGYDVLGRRVSVTTPNPEPVSGGGPATVTSTTVFDARGLVSARTAPATIVVGGVRQAATAETLFEYNAFGEVTKVTNPLGAGNPAADAANVVYGYDDRGNRTSRTSWVQLTAGGGLTSRTETWGYNLADQLIRHEPLWYDPAVANAETWSYDPLDGELVESTVGSTADGSFRAARYQRYNTGAVRSVCFDDDPTPEVELSPEEWCTGGRA